MSGFVNGEYELTATKAKDWHRNRSCCASLSDIAHAHLASAGFTWHVGTGGNFLKVTGPGVAEKDTAPLFEAVSGRKSWR